MLLCQTFIIAIAVLTSCFYSKASAQRHWSCPLVWSPFDDGNNITCVQMGYASVSTLDKAVSECSKKDASLIVIDSPEKWELFKGLTKSRSQENNFWLGLKISSHEGLVWITKDGNIPVSYLPTVIRPTTTDTSMEFLYRSNRNSLYQHKYYNSMVSGIFICERKPDCDSGYYGGRCENKCHCHGQSCTNGKEVCLHGCHLGWMGTSCDKPKEDASVKYFCVRSPDVGDFVHIRIYTKKVEYDKIQAVDDEGNSMEWCNGTQVSFNSFSSVHTIQLRMDHNTTDQCAGKVTNGSYEWRIKIQEKDGFVSRNDQEVLIKCDQFTDYETMTIMGKTEIKEENEKHVEEIKAEREVITLDVVDSFNGSVISSAEMGSNVALRIQYGIGKDSDMNGVEAYNCFASSPDGTKTVMLLDQNGCALAGSIISPFYRNGSKSLITKPFSLPRLPGSESVNFKCSFSPCYDQLPCNVGCYESSVNETLMETRHRRSADLMEKRISSFVHVGMPEKKMHSKTVHYLQDV